MKLQTALCDKGKKAMKIWFKEEGQALIQVTIALVVLLGFVALAVDLSFGYAQRRDMQNAADAGALAGAYQMCFVDPTQSTVEAVAEEYATVRNLAQLANVELSHPGVAGGLITVTTESTLPTFIAGVIGQPEITAGAQAVAACGAANSACGFSPIAFHEPVWDSIPCGAKFYVWSDDRVDISDPACATDPLELDSDFGYVIGTSDRGWVQFPRPQVPYPDEFSCADNCGANQTKCIIEHDYDGNISIADGGICLPSQPGVADSVRKEIQDRVDSEGPYQSNILLWDRGCTAGEGVTGTCAGNPYHVNGFGCIIMLGTSTVDGCGKQNLKVVMAQKSCDCTSTCGTTDGTPGDPNDVKAVNILR